MQVTPHDIPLLVLVVVILIALILPLTRRRARKKAAMREWLMQSISYFRNMAFFEADAALSDADLADKLEALQIKEQGDTFDPSDELADLFLLKWDKNRIWWGDIQADVSKGNDIYVQILQEWGRISRGAFSPENIEETWKGEEGPIFIYFTLNGTRHCIQPRYEEGCIDVGILKEINELIAGTGYRFECYEPFDETAFVIVLTLDEKQRLVSERGWRFADPLDGGAWFKSINQY